MSPPPLPADEPIRLSLKSCFEKDCYALDREAIQHLAREGVDRYAFARAVLRHLQLGRKIYIKRNEYGHVLPRQFHCELGLYEDDGEIPYVHFILSFDNETVRVRVHVNGFPSSLPW